MSLRHQEDDIQSVVEWAMGEEVREEERKIGLDHGGPYTGKKSEFYLKVFRSHWRIMKRWVTYLIYSGSCVENGPYIGKQVVKEALWGRFCGTLRLD